MRNRAIRTISITSGKGGVGKTTFTVNIANMLARMGKKVLILDGDLSLANVDVFLSKNPERNLNHFFEEEADLDSVLIKYSKNIHVLPGASGITGLTRLDAYQKKMLVDGVSEFEGRYDYMLIDTGSGIGDEVLYLSSAAQEVYVVVQPDPSSITDSYAMIKVLNQNYKINNFSIVTNQVLNDQEGMRIFSRINSVAARFLNVKMNYLGFIPFDIKMRHATSQQKLITDHAPDSLSSIGITKIATDMDRLSTIEETSGGLQFFWNQVLNVA